MPKKQINISNIIQPAFYKTFECTGEKCPVTCCSNWGIIGWSEDEYTKLKNSDMSYELKEKFDSAFIVDNNERFKDIFQYKIRYTDENKCPMLSPEGLCMVQKELGADYLCFVCTVYPRVGRAYEDTVIRTCNLSCNHVVHMICADENSMKLEIHKAENIAELNTFSVSDPPTDHEKKEYPALNYELDIFNFFYELLSDRTRSIETSIVLGAMAAQNLDKFIAKKQFDKLPAVIKALEQQLNDPKQIEKLASAKPNPSLKANFSGGLLKLLKGTDIYRAVFENGRSSEEKWNAAFKDKPFAMRNIALDIYISNHLPFRDRTFSVFDNYCYFAAEVAVIKFLAAAMPMGFDRNIEEIFEISAAYIDRDFTHNMPNFIKIIDYMRSFGVTSPAMLLGIIK